MKKQLLRAAASTVLGLSLTTGFAAADINTTGPGSSNNVTTTAKSHYEVKNNNKVGVSNFNGQTAKSGSASAYYNTTAGGATSGDATNGNSSSVTASIDNSSADDMSAAADQGSVPATGSIDNTGPGSDNNVTSTYSSSVKVTNNNDLTVCNTNTQSATTGSASVSDNTTGGSATSGSAMNTNSSDYNLSVSN